LSKPATPVEVWLRNPYHKKDRAHSTGVDIGTQIRLTGRATGSNGGPRGKSFIKRSMFVLIITSGQGIYILLD
jgi:hypothetical protein